MAASSRPARSHRPRHGLRPAPRAFTLIELLVVLAGLTVLAALAVPAFMERATQARFDRELARVDAAITEARARAARSGAALTLLASPGPGGRWTIQIERITGQPGGPVPPETPGAAPAEPVDPAQKPRRVLLELEVGFLIRPAGEDDATDEPPTADPDAASEAPQPAPEPAPQAAPEPAPQPGDDADARPIVLAILMPDGDWLPGEPADLEGPGGLRARVKLELRVGGEPDPPAPAQPMPAEPLPAEEEAP